MTWLGLTPPYATIVADPPWPYKTTGRGSSARGVNPGKSGEQYLNPDLPYSAMSLTDIQSLPVAELGDDARLYLWVTNRYLRYAWDVMEAWGFTPQERTLVWCKPPRCTTPVTTEFVLIGKRGNPARMPWHGTTWFQWGHQSGHSVKPQAFADLVELWSPGPYVELFARQPRLGWDSWGLGYELDALAAAQPGRTCAGCDGTGWMHDPKREYPGDPCSVCHGTGLAAAQPGSNE